MQSLYDEFMVDPAVAQLVEDYLKTQSLTGVTDEVILGKVFDYMDAEFQKRIKDLSVETK